MGHEPSSQNARQLTQSVSVLRASLLDDSKQESKPMATLDIVEVGDWRADRVRDRSAVTSWRITHKGEYVKILLSGEQYVAQYLKEKSIRALSLKDPVACECARCLNARKLKG